MSDDPFGNLPARRRRSPVRLVLGTVLVAAGIGALGYGIYEAVAMGTTIEQDAVARGTVRAGTGEPASFTVTGREDRDYTVYLVFPGFISDSDVQDLVSRDTRCTATTADGPVTFGGNRQDVAITIGQDVSVNHFRAPPGPVTVRCAYGTGTRGSRASRPDTIAFVVTPGAPSFLDAGVMWILGGVGLGLAGGFMVIAGRPRRR